MSIESHRECVRRYKEKHYSQGKCINCNTHTVGGFLQCKKCLSVRARWQSKRNKSYRQKRIDSNKCSKCAAPLDSDADYGHKECINCREGQYATISIRLRNKRF